jgi:hypothetical protein
MSAYMVERNHIRYLLDAAMSPCVHGHYDHAHRWFHNGTWHELGFGDFERAAQVGQMLWDENRKSTHARYPDTIEDFSNAPGPCEESFLYDQHRAASHYEVYDLAQVLKSCDCFEYQACEHDGWKESEAHAFIMALRSAAWHALPGYENAVWGAPKPRF